MGKGMEMAKAATPNLIPICSKLGYEAIMPKEITENDYKAIREHAYCLSVNYSRWHPSRGRDSTKFDDGKYWVMIATLRHFDLINSDAKGVAGTMEMEESGVFGKATLLDKVLREQGSKKGLAGVMGKWPGDESDEEVAKALEELS